jgi:hypothetical protein
MPKTDDGFQGNRPNAFGDVWDRMTSPQRRITFWSDIAIGLAGTALVYWLF